MSDSNGEERKKATPAEKALRLIDAYNLVRENPELLAEAASSLITKLSQVALFLVENGPQLAKGFEEGIHREIRRQEDRISELGLDVYYLAIPVLDFPKLFPLSDDEIRDRAYSFSCSKGLEESMFSGLRSLNSTDERHEQMRAMLDLHRKGIYYASVPLSLTLFEGILTEFLLKKNLVSIEKGEAVDDSGNKVNGIYKKLSCLSSGGGDYGTAQRLRGMKVIYDVERSRINNMRNNILHGMDVTYACRERAVQFIIALEVLLRQVTREMKKVDGLDT